VNQTGLDLYIHIKFSPQNTAVCNKSKINHVHIDNTLPGRSNSNRFALLAENEPEQTQPNPKPPPVYIRKKISNVLVNKIVALTGDGNFHVAMVTIGDIHKITLQTKSEEHFRAVSNYLDEARKNYYTYQLKNSKGLAVVLKGI